MMKSLRNMLRLLALAATAGAALTACNDSKSYAELLDDETAYINNYLADQQVVGSLPADGVFEQGDDAPYYRMDDDGNVYMRVIHDDPEGEKAAYNDLVYMRFLRYNLYSYTAASGPDGKGVLPDGDGNDATASTTFSFRYQNYEISSSSQWGEGLQLPLDYLHYGCEVELVIRSSISLTDEIASVVPYMYRVRYYKSQI